MTDSAATASHPGRVLALIAGCVLIIPGLAALVTGGALGLGYAFGRDDAGYFGTSLDRLESPTVAVTAEEIDFAADLESPGWVIERLDVDVRLRVANASSERPVFVGIAAESDVDRYLAGVAHDEVRELDGRAAVYRSRSGSDVVDAPTAVDFWAASATGAGTQELVWPATTGRWAAVVMNADGSPGVAADVDIGAKADFFLPLAVALGGFGVLATALAAWAIVFGAQGLGTPAAKIDLTTPPVPEVPASGPVTVEARLDTDLSRWHWLVKWFLALPHFIALAFLWLAFVLLTMVAGVSILFTGRYPRSIFDFNVGVMRWSWRATYYATTGGVGTDRYPPFSVHPDPTYPATLDIEPPGELSRGLVLVKWWLLAIPHYLIIAALVGGTAWSNVGNTNVQITAIGGGGVLGLLVLIAAATLLFRGRYPEPLFDLIVGINRWVFRVIAYAALMTDTYPPFRLDQGGAEPRPTDLPSDSPSGTAADPGPQVVGTAGGGR